MARRAILFLLLLLSSTLEAESFSFDDTTFDTVAHFDMQSHNNIAATCKGEIVDCIDKEEEEEEEVMMGGSEAVRRTLIQQRSISYASLKAHSVPCNKLGRSYYGCYHQRAKTNPYTRGCSAITRCARHI